MRKYLLAVAVITFAFNAGAQLTQLTKKDYENAERFMSYNIDPFIDGGNVRPNWLPGDQFWYLASTSTKSEFILVDPAKKTRTTAFDHQKLADALSIATGTKYDVARLPFQTIGFSADGKSVLFTVDSKK